MSATNPAQTSPEPFLLAETAKRFEHCQNILSLSEGYSMLLALGKNLSMAVLSCYIEIFFFLDSTKFLLVDFSLLLILWFFRNKTIRILESLHQYLSSESVENGLNYTIPKPSDFLVQPFFNVKRFIELHNSLTSELRVFRNSIQNERYRILLESSSPYE